MIFLAIPTSKARAKTKAAWSVAIASKLRVVTEMTPKSRQLVPMVPVLLGVRRDRGAFMTFTKGQVTKIAPTIRRPGYPWRITALKGLSCGCKGRDLPDSQQSGLRRDT